MFDRATILVRQATESLVELELAGEINVFSAAKLHDEAMRVADRGQDVLVSTEQLTALDVSALQILLALRVALARQGRGLQFRGLSAEMLDTLRLAGMDACLGALSTSTTTPETTALQTATHG
jgi:anti-anti-sigma factor